MTRSDFITAVIGGIIGAASIIYVASTVEDAQADHHVMLLSQCQDVKTHTMRVVELHVVEKDTAKIVKHWVGTTFVGQIDQWAEQQGIDTDTHDAPIVSVGRRLCKPRMES